MLLAEPADAVEIAEPVEIAGPVVVRAAGPRAVRARVGPDGRVVVRGYRGGDPAGEAVRLSRCGGPGRADPGEYELAVGLAWEATA